MSFGDGEDTIWQFPAGGEPFRIGDRFRLCADVCFGDLYCFLRVDDDYVEIIAAADDETGLDVYRCEPAGESGALAFVRLPGVA